ncbi:MAG: ABC transporter permease [Muribaculaceae bacterium]|nr:ABC transporter permease [Muribaculaceae bacterium]
MSGNNRNIYGFWAIAKRSLLQIVRRPIYWVAFFLLPLFCFIMLSTLMEEGLPVQVPAAIVDKDGTELSRNISQTLAGMQMVDIQYTPDSFTEARHLMQEGKIFGYFLIPENYEAQLLAGRAPEITFYTNMTYYVPASLLFKTFKATALYTKAGLAVNVIGSAGVTSDVTSMLQPVNITTRGIGNPELNYAIYLCNSFAPCVLQLMILLVTCFSLGQEIKYHTSVHLLNMAGGSIYRAIAAKMLPQTIIWWIIALFLESWLFRWQAYPVNGSWLWLTISELMFVLACQGMAIFFFGILPNLRLSLSVSALLGILSFSIAAFSFPAQSMYPAIGIFSWLMPIRYNFLIYGNIALNGLPLYYSRIWFVMYIVYMLLPLTVLWRIRREMAQPVYAP